VTDLRSNTARPAAWAIRQPVGVVKRRRAWPRYQVQRVARPWSFPTTIMRRAMLNAASHSSRVQSVTSILETGAVAPKSRVAVAVEVELLVMVRSAGGVASTSRRPLQTTTSGTRVKARRGGINSVGSDTCRTKWPERYLWRFDRLGEPFLPLTSCPWADHLLAGREVSHYARGREPLLSRAELRILSTVDLS